MIDALLHRVVLGNSALNWITALGVVAGVTVLARMAQRKLTPKLLDRATRTGKLLDICLAHLLARIRFLFILAIALNLGAQSLDLPPRFGNYLNLLPPVALILQLAAWGFWGIGHWIERQFNGPAGKDGTVATRAAVLGFILRLALGSLALLLALNTLGFKVTTLLASLGIGGIAVALALQNILGDLFASLSIALDKPFVIGDFITVDDCLGTVDYIGLRSTRIHSLSGEQIIISNSDLLKTRIHNYKKLAERRVVFTLSISYQTPPEKAARIPLELQRIIEKQPNTRFDRAHLKTFNDSGLQYEVVYFVLDPDFNHYMDLQQGINLGIMQMFRQEGISFSFPARTVLLQGAEVRD